MLKLNKIFYLTFLLLLITMICGLWTITFSQEESVTITTYYPSPYGSYNELQTNKLAVGDTDGLGTLDAADQPYSDGNIRLKVYSGNPENNGLPGRQGEILFSSEDSGSLFLHNGSQWAAQGGGGGGATQVLVVIPAPVRIPGC